MGGSETVKWASVGEQQRQDHSQGDGVITVIIYLTARGSLLPSVCVYYYYPRWHARFDENSQAA